MKGIKKSGSAQGNNEAIYDISQKLDVLIRLIASGVGADLSIAERAPLLSRSGLSRHDIAYVCGTSPELISVRLAEAKRKKTARKRK